MLQSTSAQQFFVAPRRPFSEIRMTFNSTLPYAPHFHSDFSLGLILAGSTCLSLGAKKYVAEKGDIVLIGPDQVHSCNPIEQSARSYYMIFIDQQWMREEVFSSLCGGDAKITRPVIKNAYLHTVALSIIDTLADSTGDVCPQVRSLFLELQNSSKCFEPANTALRDKKMSFFKDIPPSLLREEHVGIANLASSAGLRRESFARSFRKVCNLSPSNYLHCLRLEHGRMLLQQGKSVVEAATASGYVDQSHFHRMFLKFFSVTPGYYRKHRCVGHIRTRKGA